MSKPLESRYDGCGLIARAREVDKHLPIIERPEVDERHRYMPIEQLVAIGVAAAREIDARRQIFQKSCNRLALEKLGVVVFDEMDVYELEGLPWMDVSPSWFLKERFGKDYERLEVEHANRMATEPVEPKSEKEVEDDR
jgi:hypothetical protein